MSRSVFTHHHLLFQDQYQLPDLCSCASRKLWTFSLLGFTLFTGELPGRASAVFTFTQAFFVLVIFRLSHFNLSTLTCQTLIANIGEFAKQIFQFCFFEVCEKQHMFLGGTLPDRELALRQTLKCFYLSDFYQVHASCKGSLLLKFCLEGETEVLG